MPRRLLQAAATIALVVCLGTSGHGWMSTTSENKRRHIGRGSVAAGRAHTVMAMPDGRVMAWGAGGRGQIGDGGIVDRWTPTLVPGVEDVVAVTAGAAHTVALTATGGVYSWGANTFGRLGDGTRKRRVRPVPVKGLRDVAMIAAGRAHTLALTSDGVVFAWGRNTEGQLGDGTRSTSIVPIPVRGLANIAVIAAGDRHSLAVTRDGRIFAWGSNEFSMLGDGTTKDRLKPVAIALTDVVSVAGGAAHSLALRRNGEVYSWGRGANGELGTGSNRAASTPKPVTGLAATAIAAGQHFSAAIRTDGTVVTWGVNDSGQLGDGTTIRRTRSVTVDGLGSVLALALGDAHAVAVTASGDVRAWGEGDSGRLGGGSISDQTAPLEVVSDIPDWGTDPADDDPPEPPSITPASGFYPAPQTVTITSSDPSDIIRYTIDGTQPGASAPIYVQPFVVDASVTVNARSFSPNGEGSDPSSATFTIDTQLPTIVATTTPPLQAGWMTTPVTVSFTCADDNGVASCTGPVTVMRDGAQSVTGVAVDRAGHTSSATVNVSLDLTPPLLAIETPADHAIVDAGDIIVTGAADDSASGIVDARCNGEPAELLAGRIRCVVPLSAGRNAIILHAIDAVGHNASTAISITRALPGSAIQLTPSTRAMTISETGSLTLQDQSGQTVDGAQWSTSDEAIVKLSDSNPPTLTALAVGDVTITAEKDGQSAEATIHVAAALVAGATRWTLPSLSGLSLETPLFANRVDASSPELFSIGTDDLGEATVRAVSSDGEVLWQQHTNGAPLMGDSFGGVLAGVWADGDSGGDFRAYVRLGGNSASSWRFESAASLSRPAQAPDGTIYALEFLPGGIDRSGAQIFDKYMLVMDGDSGTVIRRTPLPRQVVEFAAEWDGMVLAGFPPIVCKTTRDEWAPETQGPVVGSDGRGYYVVARHVLRKRGQCVEPLRIRPDRTIDMGLDLVIASPTSAPQVINLYSEHCEGAYFTTLPCDLPVRALQIMPDGVGGTLVTWERGTMMVGQSVFVQRALSRVEKEGAIQERFVDPEFSLEMIGQAGTALTYDNGWKAIDLPTGAVKWAAPLPDLTPLAVRPDGGLASYDWSTGELRITDATGALESTQPFALDWRSVHDSGDWIGRRGSVIAAVVGDFADATRWSALRGNAQGQLSFRRAGIGLSLKSQMAKPPFPIYHTAIKIAPINQAWLADWYLRHTELVQQKDEFGNLFMMLGAGLPNGQDTASNCAIPGLEPLVSDYNRDGDVGKPVIKWTRLPIAERDEFRAIASLLDLNERYTDSAPYACFPEDLTGFYNSNSYVHSLLTHAGISHDEHQPKSPSPGWQTTIPLMFFPGR